MIDEPVGVLGFDVSEQIKGFFEPCIYKQGKNLSV